jgi:hypothetical protein
MNNINKNTDVTDILNVKKYIPQEELYEYFDYVYRVPFPSFVPKTNEIQFNNVQLLYSVRVIKNCKSNIRLGNRTKI